MPGCCAVGCKNRSEKGFAMKIIPKDPVRRKLWILKIRRVNEKNQVWTPSPRSFVCEVHFADDQWEDRDLKKLKPDAIPTIFQYNTKNLNEKLPGKKKNLNEKLPGKKKILKEKLPEKKQIYRRLEPKCEAVSSELQLKLFSANCTISCLEAKLLSTNQDFADLKRRMDEELLSASRRIFTLTEENKKLKEQLQQSTKLIKASPNKDPVVALK